MPDDQLELHLPAPPVSGDAPLIPARMVNEFVYCPRLAYLMWAQGEWEETGDTTPSSASAISSLATTPSVAEESVNERLTILSPAGVSSLSSASGAGSGALGLSTRA